jgi:hypothetical protein
MCLNPNPCGKDGRPFRFTTVELPSVAIATLQEQAKAAAALLEAHDAFVAKLKKATP